MRVEQNYDHQTYEDLYGNRGTFAHNPRMCLKGYTFHRRVYGPYRLKGPLMRQGLEGVDGCRLAGADARKCKRKYKFDAAFLDDMMRVSWDTAFTYVGESHDCHCDAVQRRSRALGACGSRAMRRK